MGQQVQTNTQNRNVWAQKIQNFSLSLAITSGEADYLQPLVLLQDGLANK